MKKIFILLLTAILSIAFTSCENDPIDEIPVKYPKLIFPEPFTVWGGSVSDVITFMNSFNLTTRDTTPGNVTLVDGTVVQKYFKIYSGSNPYDENNSKIVYMYCFDNRDSGLKAVRVELLEYTQFKLDEVIIQFKNSGYHYDGLVNSKYYLFSNDNTTIKCYLAEHAFVFSKKNDADEIANFKGANTTN